MGSMLAKGAFLEQAAADPAKAIEQFSEHRLEYNLGASTAPTLRPGEIVVDCFTSQIYDRLKQTTHEKCSDQDAWTKEKQTILSIVGAFNKFLVERSQALNIDDKAQSVFVAFETISKAAMRDDDVGPADLKA